MSPVKNRGLGKGLKELLSQSLETPLSSSGACDMHLSYVGLDQLSPSPFQPRQHMPHEGLEQLAESIRAQGILQPVVVRKKGDDFEIVAGERRFRAAALAGLKEIPVLVRQVSDEAAMAMALIENIQRENLNPIEEATALKRLIEELQLTHLQVAEAVGKSRASVTNLLRLLSLNDDVQALLINATLEMGHARALLAIKGEEQSELAKKIVEKGLSVRETERLVSQLQSADLFVSKEITTAKVDPNIRLLEESLSEKFGAAVKISHGSKGQGKVVIRYNDVDELEGILAHFR